MYVWVFDSLCQRFRIIITCILMRTYSLYRFTPILGPICVFDAFLMCEPSTSMLQLKGHPCINPKLSSVHVANHVFLRQHSQGNLRGNVSGPNTSLTSNVLTTTTHTHTSCEMYSSMSACCLAQTPTRAHTHTNTHTHTRMHCMIRTMYEHPF